MNFNFTKYNCAFREMCFFYIIQSEKKYYLKTTISPRCSRQFCIVTYYIKFLEKTVSGPINNLQNLLEMCFYVEVIIFFC